MKNKFMQTAGAIGLVIGGSLFWCILFFVNKFRTNNGLEKVDTYIANCEVIPLQVGNYNVVESNITGFFTRMGSKDYSTEEAIFYDLGYKKYFSLIFIGNDQYETDFDFFLTHYLKKGQEIKATVNKIEMADTAYGTQRKPVPVFWFTEDTSEKWFPFEESYIYPPQYGADKVKQIYHDAVAIYLTFVKSKEDFKKMFPKK